MICIFVFESEQLLGLWVLAMIALGERLKALPNWLCKAGSALTPAKSTITAEFALPIQLCDKASGKAAKWHQLHFPLPFSAHVMYLHIQPQICLTDARSASNRILCCSHRLACTLMGASV